jgi:patatin-like phospholipase/acyl hydrolase
MAEVASFGSQPCPTFVVATSAADADGPPVLFRSYACKRFNADKCAIWQAARCTSAAPSFFRPMFVDVPAPGGWYVDGGLRHNNPSQLALDEVARIWPTISRFCLVSIGTGQQNNVEFMAIEDSHTPKEAKSKVSVLSPLTGFPGAKILRKFLNTPTGFKELQKIAQACVEMSTSSEPVHQAIFRQANSRYRDLRFPYYRFNVEKGMDSIGLQEWKARVRIGELTRQ